MVKKSPFSDKVIARYKQPETLAQCGIRRCGKLSHSR